MQKDENGNTELHYAAEKGHIATVALLLDRGADTTVKDKDGNTAYTMPQKCGHITVVLLLEPRG